MNEPLILPLIFAVLMGVAVLVYVLLDGYDLGVGMLLPRATTEEKNTMEIGRAHV